MLKDNRARIEGTGTPGFGRAVACSPCIRSAGLDKTGLLHSPFVFSAAGRDSRQKQSCCLEAELELAILTEGICVVYQPIIDLQSGNVVSVEALARWHHPVLHDIGPATFIPIAEETGLIHRLGTSVLRLACLQAREWVDEFGLDQAPTMTVNVSALQLQARDYARGVSRVLSETSLEPRLLELDITETRRMCRTRATVKMLDDLRSSGVRIALDDFGAGYCGLAELICLPADTIKLDRGLVEDIAEDRRARAVVQALVELAHTLHLNVVAEGIESEEQIDVLTRSGANCGQGYKFCRPSSPECLSSFFHERACRGGLGLPSLPN